MSTTFISEEEKQRIDDIFEIYQIDGKDEDMEEKINDAKKKAQSRNEEIAIKADSEKILLFEELSKRRRNRRKKENKKRKKKNKIIEEEEEEINYDDDEEKNNEERKVRKKKKKKKTIKKKKKKKKKTSTNFLLDDPNKYKLNQDEEEKEKEDDFFTTWKHVLEKKIISIFPPNMINRNALVKNIQTIIDGVKIRKLDDEEMENNLNEIIDYDNIKIEPEVEKLEETEIINKQPIGNYQETIDKRKQLYKSMKKNEKKYNKSQKDTKDFLEAIKKYKNEMSKRHINRIYQIPFKDNNKTLNINEEDRIKERIINFNLKTFDTFNLEEIIKFWKKKSKAIKIKEDDNQDMNINTKEPEKKIQEKAVNVKYVYTSPSEDIKKIIPFASKKYTIQKKE